MTAQPATLPPDVVHSGPTVADVDELKAMLAELEALTAALPEDDGRPVETLRHHTQMVLFRRSLLHAWRGRQDFFVGMDQFVYYSTEQAQSVIREINAEYGEGEEPPPGKRAYRGPDLFVVRDIDGSYLRQKWVTWMEGGRYPDLIVELLSPSTRHVDLGEKKDLYEQTFRTTEYFVWDPFDPSQFQGWRLAGEHYQPIEPDKRGWLVSEVLEFWLGPWEGTYDQDQATWLRLYDADEQLVLTTEEAAEERAETAEERAETAEERAEAAEAEAARLRARLAELEEEGSER